MPTKRYKETLMQTASNYDAISQELFNIAHHMEESQMYNPETAFYSVVRNAEVSTVTLRSLAIRAMDRGHTHPIYDGVSSAMGISVEEHKRWIKITVPSVLPNRNARDNTLFITRPLRHSLIQFQRENPIERFQHCMICIVHKYDEALGIRRIRDYDNIETKRYLDVIESVFLTNDTGHLCTVLQATEIGDRDCTEFYLMLPETLGLWAQEHVKTHT